MKSIPSSVDTQKDLTDDDLWNPYSFATTFIMYIYSLELGNPPLYAELNRICREMDMTHFDKIKTGDEVMNELGGVYYNFAGCLILFRGA